MPVLAPAVPALPPDLRDWFRFTYLLTSSVFRIFVYFQCECMGLFSRVFLKQSASIIYLGICLGVLEVGLQYVCILRKTSDDLLTNPPFADWQTGLFLFRHLLPCNGIILSLKCSPSCRLIFVSLLLAGHCFNQNYHRAVPVLTPERPFCCLNPWYSRTLYYNMYSIMRFTLNV